MNTNYQTISVSESSKGIYFITLNRPEVLNAINSQMISDLGKFFNEVGNSDLGARCIVVTGSGEKAFCAGADLKERNGLPFGELVRQHRDLESLNFTIARNPIPMIAAVNGYAFGGGAEIALLADFIYASKNAVFGLPEAKVGLMPGFGGTQRMARRIGAARTKELIFTASRVDAETALSWGLVNKIFPSENLVEEALATAQIISKLSPISIANSKIAVDCGVDLPIDDGLELEIRCYHEVMKSEDRIEGIKAFNEKREPRFMGK